MKKPLKIAAIVVLALIVLVGAGVVVALVFADSLAKKGIEAGGTYALGVNTRVDGVSLHVFSGRMSMSGLDVANPAGFASPHFLGMKKGDVAVSLGSLQQDVVEIPTLTLSGIDVNLERGAAGSNYGTILDNLKKLQGSGPAPASGGSEKKLVIRELTIDGIAIHADMLGAPGQIGQAINSAAKINIPIDRIQLKDVGKTGSGVGGSGVSMQELSSIIVQAVLAAAADKGGGILPADLLGDLKGGLSALGGLKDLSVSVVGKAGEAAGQLGGAVGKIGEGAGKALNDAGKGIADGIGGLFGGGKKDEKKEPPKKP
jgi:uncharacterized protein involved in outer membrane biogenesis